MLEWLGRPQLQATKYQGTPVPWLPASYVLVQRPRGGYALGRLLANGKNQPAPSRQAKKSPGSCLQCSLPAAHIDIDFDTSPLRLKLSYHTPYSLFLDAFKTCCSLPTSGRGSTWYASFLPTFRVDHHSRLTAECNRNTDCVWRRLPSTQPRSSRTALPRRKARMPVSPLSLAL